MKGKGDDSFIIDVSQSTRHPASISPFLNTTTTTPRLDDRSLDALGQVPEPDPRKRNVQYDKTIATLTQSRGRCTGRGGSVPTGGFSHVWNERNPVEGRFVDAFYNQNIKLRKRLARSPYSPFLVSPYSTNVTDTLCQTA